MSIIRAGHRFLWIGSLGAFGLALGWTVLILLLPQMRFAVLSPRVRIAIESAGAVVAGMTAALAYVRYSLTGARTWLAVSVSFVVIGLNQVLFGLVVSPEVLGDRAAVYFWNTGRLLVGGILLVGAMRLERPPVMSARLRRFVVATFWSLLALGVAELILWELRGSLPPLTTAPRALARIATGALPGLTPTVVAMGTVGALLFLAAAFVILRDPDPERISPWLPPALILGAMSHVHYMLFPTAFTDRVSTGDLLRLSFSAVLLAGVVWEIHRLSSSERDRALELDVAYQAERDRAQQLEAIDRSREELFSILTHELMHPVAGVRGVLVTLSARWDDLDEAVRREMLERARRESARLRDLAEEAATALHLEDASFAMYPRDLDVDVLVREAVEAADSRLDGRLIANVDVVAQAAKVRADRARVLQVTRNLLSNAAKFSPSGSPVELRVTLEQGALRFAVVDEGPGVDPEHATRLFRRFSRLPSTGDVPGSGLGLYISRRIVEAHGGRIWHERTEAGGSAFCFTLPGAER